ncbi:MAG: Cell division protein FtsZ [Bacteroidia bacterium]|nr:Cell division protein FtsZ [Bacteroidia bacterium]
MNNDMIKFDLPKEQPSIIKVIGVGGGGSNAVNHMFKQGIKGVDFVVCNTDQQALDRSPVPHKIALGASLTEGRGAGSIPEVGKNAALENLDSLKEVLNEKTKMVFITAGMGGGTGTGAAPIIAKAAKDQGILTVGIVTIPFQFEGRKRKSQADYGLEELKKSVDTLLVISNEKLRDMYGNLKLGEAFAQADNILTIAAKGIAEIITVSGYVNVDFEDVRTVMKDSGVAIMGSASASGPDRAVKAVQTALASPLLNDNNIEGASNILLYINSGSEEVTMDEVSEITDYIQNEAGMTAEIIWGNGYDEDLGDSITVTVIATGFKTKSVEGFTPAAAPKKVVKNLVDETPVTKAEPVAVTVTTPEPVAFVETPVAVVAPPVQEYSLEPTLKIVEPVINVEEPVATEKVEEPVITEPYLKTAEPVTETTEETPVVETYTEIATEIEETVVAKTEEEPELFFSEPELENEKTVLTEFTLNDEEPFVFLKDETTKQTTFEFEVPKTKMPHVEEFTPVAKVEESVVETDSPISSDTLLNITSRVIDNKESEMDSAEMEKIQQERIARLKQVNQKYKTLSGLSELENEPAYKRRNVSLDNTSHSSENNISRFTLSDEKNENNMGNKTELRANNSFLHDNVD